MSPNPLVQPSPANERQERGLPHQDHLGLIEFLASPSDTGGRGRTVPGGGEGGPGDRILEGRVGVTKGTFGVVYGDVYGNGGGRTLPGRGSNETLFQRGTGLVKV